MNLIKGQIASADEARDFLNNIESYVFDTLKKRPLDTQTVISAADRLSHKLNVKNIISQLCAFGISNLTASYMLIKAKQYLSREYLERKLLLELGDAPFTFRDIGENCFAAYRPLGVITHIAAGNAAGLPAFSVLEGLMTGNINLLKLPGTDDGLSTTLLKMLIETEPQLAPYIYVFDIPSVDADSISKLLSISDACAVWGSDFAISGIRSIAPCSLKLIEWGHKLSFACVTQRGETNEALLGIAKDICENEQLLCSSPQCVYFEAQDFNELAAFGERLAVALKEVSSDYPRQLPDINTQADITAQLSLSSIESLIEKKKVFCCESCAIIADDNPVLCASPKYRTIWLKPMRSDSFFNTLRSQSGYLQTVGLACAEDERAALEQTLYSCGVCRIMPCGCMAKTHAGEPHDGLNALRCYVKAVVRATL